MKVVIGMYGRTLWTETGWSELDAGVEGKVSRTEREVKA